MLDYIDVDCKRRRVSLGHFDKRKAEMERLQKEQDLIRGVSEPSRMKMSEFLSDCLERSRGQVSHATLYSYESVIKDFIGQFGDLQLGKITLRQGETFLQACLDKKLSPSTANKKISKLKTLFNRGIHRGYIEKNPFAFLKSLKVPRRQVRTYNDDECSRILAAAKDIGEKFSMPWTLIIDLALSTGLRRGEILNLVWGDIDFSKKVVTVNPKKDTDLTWKWSIKDSERRTLPLTEDLVLSLSRHLAEQPEGKPYLFVPVGRFDYLLETRKNQKWNPEHANLPVNNFVKYFKKILKMAGIEKGTFHDFRRTCLSRWISNGLSEFDVMSLAGHSEFSTTHRFYLNVQGDLLKRARAVSNLGFSGNSGTFLAHQGLEQQKTLDK